MKPGMLAAAFAVNMLATSAALALDAALPAYQPVKRNFGRTQIGWVRHFEQ